MKVRNLCLFVIVALGVTFAACMKNPQYLGREVAASRLDEVLNDSTHTLVNGDTLVKDKKTAILLATAVASSVYGEEKILSEAPYEAYLIKGYWVVSGTIPVGYMGGGFEVIINARDGRVVNVTHFK
jgi:hypothetical protein